LSQINVQLNLDGKIDEGKVAEKVYNLWFDNRTEDAQSLLTRKVREVPDEVTDGFKVFTYLKWFASKDDVKDRFWFHLNRFDHIQVVAQYRMGCHWLNIDTGRMGSVHVPRIRRICTCCDSGEREDELHLLDCPVYAGLRQEHVVDVDIDDEDDARMRNFMLLPEQCHDHWSKIAKFLLKSKVVRNLAITSGN
jgi:hypothetical protein